MYNQINLNFKGPRPSSPGNLWMSPEYNQWVTTVVSHSGKIFEKMEVGDDVISRRPLIIGLQKKSFHKKMYWKKEKLKTEREETKKEKKREMGAAEKRRQRSRRVKSANGRRGKE